MNLKTAQFKLASRKSVATQYIKQQIILLLSSSILIENEQTETKNQV